jgi:hypothetical protein
MWNVLIEPGVDLDYLDHFEAMSLAIVCITVENLFETFVVLWISRWYRFELDEGV